MWFLRQQLFEKSYKNFNVSGITNRYACFYDSDEGGDPLEILKQVQNDKKAKKTEVGGTKPANNQTANNKAPAKKDPKKEDVGKICKQVY